MAEDFDTLLALLRRTTDESGWLQPQLDDPDSAAVFRSVPLRPVRASCVMPAMARSDQRPVTVHMIAEHVGVSASAVSTVLADRHEERRLAPATVEKIRKAVRDLGYVPNVAARRLRAQDPEVHQIELGILTSFEAPLFLVSRVLRQVQRMADAHTGPGAIFPCPSRCFTRDGCARWRGCSTRAASMAW